MNKITDLTNSILQQLPTGTILILQENGIKDEVMILRNVMHNGTPQDIVSGETWRPLDAVLPAQVKEVWQPKSNMAYLSIRSGTAGLSVEGCELRYKFKKKTDKELKIEKLQQKAQEIQDELEELKNT